MSFRPSLLALAAGLSLCGTALAQSTDRPWYVGAKQDFTHNSNVFNGPGGGESSDTVSTTSIFGGVNVPFGRQRVFANATVNHQRYSDFNVRDNTGYSLAAGLDWSTIERLSGNVRLNADRRQADYNSGGIVPVSLTNIERSEDLQANVRLGVVTKLAFEGGVGHRRVAFSAPEFASREYRLDRANLGVSYRPSGILTLGTGLSGERTRYLAAAFGQAAPDRSKQHEIYGTAVWVPTGASTVNARIAFGKTEYDRATAADFDGVTGYVAWTWKPSARWDLTTTLSRETGQDNGFLRLFDNSTVTATDFSRVTNTLAFRGNYELTGKIMLTGGLAYAQRSLVDGFSGATGRDKTTTVALGARWAATRTMTFGCNASHDARSASGAGAAAYDSTRFGCFGQIVLD